MLNLRGRVAECIDRVMDAPLEHVSQDADDDLGLVKPIQDAWY